MTTTFNGLSADDVSAVMSKLPEAARKPDSGIMFNNGALIVPDAYASQAAAAVSDLAGSYKQLLINYAIAKQQKIVGGGISVNIATSGAPQMIEASTDATSLAFLNTAVAVAAANPAATTPWVSTSGTVVTLNATDVAKISAAVQAFVQATFATLGAVIAAINAGTVTTQATVDNFAAPAWPANS